MGEKILVHTDSLLKQHLHGLVGAVQEARIGVHVQKPIEVLGVVVLHAANVEVKQLVTLCNVVSSEFIEVVNAKKSCCSNCVPVLPDLIIYRWVKEVGDHVKNALVFVCSNDEFNFCVELPGLHQLLRPGREEGCGGEGRVWNSLKTKGVKIIELYRERTCQVTS